MQCRENRHRGPTPQTQRALALGNMGLGRLQNYPWGMPPTIRRAGIRFRHPRRNRPNQAVYCSRSRALELLLALADCSALLRGLGCQPRGTVGGSHHTGVHCLPSISRR